MAFRKYKTIGEVLEAYQIELRTSDFLVNSKSVDVPDILVKELDFVIRHLPYKISEAAIGEMIIFPILKEIWKMFATKLMLWSHKSISFTKELTGVPDYLIARSSPLGVVVLDTPLLAVVEAKKDDFEGGWAQCALGMYTIQKINKNADIPVFGIVSNGDNWEFGRLTGQLLEQHLVATPLYPVEILYSQLCTLMHACVLNIDRYEVGKCREK